MKEPAPEFHVRPRNKEQQAVSAQYAAMQQQGGPGQAYNNTMNLQLNVGSNDVPGRDGSYDPAGQITLQMGNQGGIENIAFADEWDDSAIIDDDDDEGEEDEADGTQGQQGGNTSDIRVEDLSRTGMMQIDQPVGIMKEESRSPVHPSLSQQQQNIPVPGFPSSSQQLAPSGQTNPAPPQISVSPNLQAQLSAKSPASVIDPSLFSVNGQSGSEPHGSQLSPHLVASASSSSASSASKPRVLSQLAIGQSPYIQSFLITFSSTSPAVSPSPRSIQHVLSNSTVRQHTLSCPKSVDRIYIVPRFSSTDSATAQGTSAHSLKIAMRPQHTVAEAPESRPEATRWLARPMQGLNVLEIGTPDGTEFYRIFIQKTA